MKRTKHSLSHYNLTSFDMGQLVPVGLQEVLPGDTFNHQTSALVRVSPLVTPVMHPVQVRIHHWFVPFRLIWDQWEDFITGGPDGESAPDVPLVTSIAGANGILDYMGVPPGTPANTVSILPVRAYNLIYNEFYRDQDLVDEVSLGQGQTLRCAWERDYFTAARPFLQKGPAVSVPVGGQAPVLGNFVMDSTGGGSEGPLSVNADSSVRFQSGGSAAGQLDIVEGMFADLDQASGGTVNDFRRAFALQRYQEARARYGSRYTEYLQYLGVTPADARLQRPEYLGGGKQTISFSEVLQTAADDIGQEQTPVGTLRGHGIAALRSNRYRKFFQEHGYVLTLMSARPKTMYANGVDKLWLRQTKEDFYQKELEAIGQQEVFNREVKATHATPDGIFGYTNRYEEYRRVFSKATGEMRDILDSWHLARDFETDPALNAEFINCEPSKRIFAAQENDTLWVMVNHSLQARRMVNKFAQSRII